MVAPQHRLPGRLLVAATLAFIAVVTLTPTSAPGGVRYAFCLVCGTVGARDVFLNVVLFLPYGAAFRLAGISRRRAAISILATTCTIELLQLLFVAGRYASLNDVVTNAAGGALGWLLAPLVVRLLSPDATLARRAQITTALGGVALVAFGLLVLRPSLPDTQYYGQWQRRWPSMAVFQGKLLAASFNGIAIPNDAMVHDSMAAALRRGDEFTLDATVVAGPTSENLAPIVTISAEHLGVVLLLGQNSRALVMRVRTRASALHFSNPAFSVDSVFPQEGGDTLRLHFSQNGHEAHAEWWNLGKGTHGTRDIVIAPVDAMLFLVPLDWSMTGRREYALLFVLGLWAAALAWFGVFAFSRRPSWLALVIPAAAAVVALEIVPRLTGDLTAGSDEWLACVFGVALGVVLAAVARRSRIARHSVD